MTEQKQTVCGSVPGDNSSVKSSAAICLFAVFKPTTCQLVNQIGTVAYKGPYFRQVFFWEIASLALI